MFELNSYFFICEKNRQRERERERESWERPQKRWWNENNRMER